MIGKIIDINLSEAFVNFNDGRMVNIVVNQLPPGSKIGDTVNIQTGSIGAVNFNSIHLL